MRAYGRRVIAVGGDLGDPQSVTAVVAETTERLGSVDILVANAGPGQRADLEQITVEGWDRMLAVNLRVPFLLAQAVAPGMRQRHFGRIVFMTSAAAFTGGILGPHYSASKAGFDRADPRPGSSPGAGDGERHRPGAYRHRDARSRSRQSQTAG